MGYSQKTTRNALIAMILLLFAMVGGKTISSAQEPGNHVPVLDNTYGFLSYWQATNGEMLLGAPVTGVFQERGLLVQYFERGRLEYHPELPGAPVLPGRVGAEYAEMLQLYFNPASEPGPLPGVIVFEQTGYTLREPFLGFWRAHGGVRSFGYPISEPLWEYIDQHMVQVQYFERARLERHPIGQRQVDQIRISSLGRALALLRGYGTAAENVGSLPNFIATATPTPPPPSPTPVPILPALVPVMQPTVASAQIAPYGNDKHIIVNLSKQWLYAFDGGVLVYDAPVSTGRKGFDTPTGAFAIYAKVPLQTMSGTIRGETYRVPNVPHAMYITGDIAMHGTYWHNLFGSGVRASHGCINLPLHDAKWIYDWAPVGTPVYVVD